MSTELREIQVKTLWGRTKQFPILRQIVTAGGASRGVVLNVSAGVEVIDGGLVDNSFQATRKEAGFIADILTDLNREEREELASELILFSKGEEIQINQN